MSEDGEGGAGGDDGKQGEDGGEAEDGGDDIEEAVGRCWDEAFLRQHFNDVGDDVGDAGQATVTQAWQVNACAVRADAVLHQSAPFALCQGEQGSDNHDKNQHKDDEVAQGAGAFIPDGLQIAAQGISQGHASEEACEDGDECHGYAKSSHGKNPFALEQANCR